MVDIRENLAEVLKDGSEITGAFSYSLKHPDAPNPGLRIDRVGNVGLPLGPRDAEAFKGIADLEQNGHSFGLRTLHGPLSWTTLCICNGLGVREKVSKPRCELTNVRLSEAGSSMLTPVTTEKAGTIVAAFAIVLPSKFSGGTVRFTYGDRAETHECIPGTVTDSAVIAWHRDATVEAQPIAEGYQLALYYGIIHTTDHPVPTLAAQDVVLARLSQVLSSWDEGERGGFVPSKIVYLLKNKYSQEQLSSSAFTGTDARTISLVKTAVRRCGAHLGLATLICKEEGLGLIAQRRDWVDDDWLSEEENIEGFNDLMDIETDMKLQHLVDFDGRPLQCSLELDLDNEAIPANLEASVKSEKPDKRMIGFVDANELRLRQVYYRTVLVIWPRWLELAHPGPEVQDAEPPAKRRRTED